MTGLGLVIQQQRRLPEFAQPGKLDCPRCVVHALGQLNLEIARGDHVVTGLQRKRFALEQQRPRGLVFVVVGINPQHAILIFLKRIQRPEILKLDGIDDAVLAVDGEGVPGFPLDEMDILLLAARIVVNDRALGLQLQIATRVTWQAVHENAFTIIEVYPQPPFRDRTKRGQRREVLKLDGGQVAVVTVQHDRVAHLTSGQVGFTEGFLGVLIHDHLVVGPIRNTR